LRRTAPLFTTEVVYVPVWSELLFPRHPFLGSATCDIRYILEEALQKHGLPNSTKTNIISASYYVQHLKSLHLHLMLDSGPVASASLSADRCKKFFHPHLDDSTFLPILIHIMWVWGC